MSVRVAVPVPAPVVTEQVSDVAEIFEQLTRVRPETPDTLKAVEPFHDVPVPVKVSVIPAP